MMQSMRGQIISLDALVSVILLMLSLGVIFAVWEHQTYAIHERLVWNELESVGSAAMNRLVLSSDFTCQLTSLTTHESLHALPYCVDTQKLQAITLSQLGLSSEYDFQITGVQSLGSNVPAEVDFVYSETRPVVISGGNVSKDELWGCQRTPNCPLSSNTLTLKVWRKM